jgi:hypothetical protein
MDARALLVLFAESFELFASAGGFAGPSTAHHDEIVMFRSG